MTLLCITGHHGDWFLDADDGGDDDNDDDARAFASWSVISSF